MARLFAAWVKDGKTIELMQDASWILEKAQAEQEQWRRLSPEELEEEILKAKARKAAEKK